MTAVEKQKKSRKRGLGILIVDVLIIAGLVLYFGILRHRPVSEIKIDGVYLPKAVEVVPFHLTDNKGKPFSQENLKGHWTMLFFGFTHCGFVCPSTLAELKKMYRQLQETLPANLMPQVVFISVDPERDTVKRLNEYVTAFHPAFIGLRGDEAATETLENQLHIMAAKSEVKGQKGKDNYTIDHTAEILLINPKGELQAYLSYPHKAEQMAKDYKLLVHVNS